MRGDSHCSSCITNPRISSNERVCPARTDVWHERVISIIGFARGNEAIADPGQDVDPRLAWLYLIAAVIMLINGILSHKQYLREQEEQKAKQPPASQQEATTR